MALVKIKPPGEPDWHLLPFTFLGACLFTNTLLDPTVMDGVSQVGLVFEQDGKLCQPRKIFVHASIANPEARKDVHLIIIVRLSCLYAQFVG